MDTITIPQSFLRNDLWQAADWRAQVVNDETGEILLTAVCGNDEEMIGVRLTTESVRQLRELTAFAEANMRRDAEQPAPDGVAHECNGVQLAELEKIIASLHEHQVLDARRVEKLEGKLAAFERRQWEDAETFGEHARQIDALETAHNRLVLSAAIETTALALQKRLEALEAAAPPPIRRHDGGFWVICPYCTTDLDGMCSACNGTRRIWEIEDGGER